jgi:hypothetical protein
MPNIGEYVAMFYLDKMRSPSEMVCAFLLFCPAANSIRPKIVDTGKLVLRITAYAYDLSYRIFL